MRSPLDRGRWRFPAVAVAVCDGRVSSDGFWAKDMTFENTAGPPKQQASSTDAASKVTRAHSLYTPYDNFIATVTYMAPSTSYLVMPRLFSKTLTFIYSWTVFLKTNLDGLIDPKGWIEWRGNFALSTLYYGEYMNSGIGASTVGRVRRPGFHVLNDSREARPFIQGESWILATGLPFWPET
ncbi:hypothetical protein HYC85_010977 [Camellia sinensis]|uniref:Pectinesterase catalytic domain-containing protein n=1 Tax=Camellia sinensis TaxID=4442 RepID=A0A7J7HJK5_CAMSI|nr:hypothetical protein HYC85_010977 [Camellia sinensis]